MHTPHPTSASHSNLNPGRSRLSSVTSFLADDAGRTPLLVLAVLLLLLPSVLDVAPVGQFAEPLTNTIAAVFAVIGVLVTARLVNRWNALREQEEAIVRFRGLSRIAFRSLSQAVNDVGRMLLAPVLGIDLRVLGIPGLDRHDVADYLAPAARAHSSSTTGVISGFWQTLSDDELAERTRRLMSEPDFAAQMFLMTARARRRLQDTLADWAPVMVTVPRAAGELDAGWDLSDALVRSQERWRLLAQAGDASTETDRERALIDFVDAVRQYRTWLEGLQGRADLPTRGYVSEPHNAS